MERELCGDKKCECVCRGGGGYEGERIRLKNETQRVRQGAKGGGGEGKTAIKIGWTEWKKRGSRAEKEEEGDNEVRGTA